MTKKQFFFITATPKKSMIKQYEGIFTGLLKFQVRIINNFYLTKSKKKARGGLELDLYDIGYEYDRREKVYICDVLQRFCLVDKNINLVRKIKKKRRG